MYDYRIQLSVGQHGTSLLPPRDDYGCRESDPEGKIESPGPQFFSQITPILRLCPYSPATSSHKVLGDTLLSLARDSQLRSQKVSPGGDLKVGMV